MWNFQIKYEKSLYEFTYESLSVFLSLQDTQLPFCISLN